MKYYTDFRIKKEDLKIEGNRKKICNNIFAFDIETTNLLKIGTKIVAGCNYLTLSEKEKEDCEFLSFMYIWQFSIDSDVYYGRTWEEFEEFLNMLDNEIPYKKIVFVHNLSFEFQFLRCKFKFVDVFARTSRHVMKCLMQDFNIDFRCTLMMTNKSLEKLGEDYLLENQKLSGKLDYNKIRNSKTKLTEIELKYCELDCLVVYNYIQYELKKYERVDKIPITLTGHVRRELRNKVQNDYSYRNKLYKAINTDPHIYNLLIEAFAGGFTHGNWLYIGEILKNVDSWDITSSYPFVMVSEKFPSKEFKKCKSIKSLDDFIDKFAYILVVKFSNLESKYFNNILSMSKCRNIRGAVYDNGRIVKASELEITLTDIDLKLILKFYDCDYEILESYYSLYNYLPKQFYTFILEKYKDKTELKNVEGYEDEYARAKSLFNALFGMSVTNTIRDEVTYDNDLGWDEKKLDNLQILMKLQEEKSKSFLSFAYGVWITAYARRNLLERVIELDKSVIYCDTDSVKLLEGYNKKVFIDYNKSVEKKLKEISKKLKIDFLNYCPKDKNGNKHLLGVFEKEGKGIFCTYKEFVTLGAKKYAYKLEDDSIHITVSGVPKKRRCSS